MGEKIGEGSSGKVYKGKWKDLQVAIKKLKSADSEDGGSEISENMLLREVLKARKLKHPYVQFVYGVCLKPFCVVTELLSCKYSLNLL